jgi:hypothetical protein
VRAALRRSSVWAPLGGLSGLARAVTGSTTAGPITSSCSRQTKLLAHGTPSAIWGGRRAAPAIGHRAAERLPEIDVQQRPLPAPACNGTREPTTGGAAGGCSIRIRHLHPLPGPRHTASRRRLQPSLPGIRCTACVAPGTYRTSLPSASHPACCHHSAHCGRAQPFPLERPLSVGACHHGGLRLKESQVCTRLIWLPCHG